jgi:hypothetical protein
MRTQGAIQRAEGAKYFENSQVEDLENRFATPPAPIVEKVSTTRIAHRSFGSRRPAADGGTARKGSAQCPLAHRVPPYAPTMSDGLRASREPGRETAQTRIQVAPAARHPAAPPTTFPRSPSSILALQRHVGNAAVAALVARAPARRVEKPTTGTPTVQRNGDEAEEPAGCGICIDPGPAGTQAHTQIQSKMGALGVDSEVKVAAGRGGGRKGRLDLARWDDKVIEIGEIKPGHATGLAQGRSDLDHYKGILEKTKNPTFKGKTVRMLDAPAPIPMIFDNPGVTLPDKGQQLLTTTNVGGVYGYKCAPPNYDYFTAGGQLKAGDKHVTLEVLKAKKNFFDSECIRKKIKRHAVEEERVRITDRTGMKRLVKPALAFSLLQSRAFHVKHELEILSGEHHQRRSIASKSSAVGLAGGPVLGAYGMAALYDLASMPSLSIWTAAQSAAGKCDAAKDLKTLAVALDEFETAMVPARYQYLTYRGDKATQPDTPAPAAGTTPRTGNAPPVPPPTPTAATAAPATAGKPAEAGVDPLKIAALAGLVLLTFLILQPELGVAAVAAAGTGGAEVAGAIGAVEAAAGPAVAVAEAALEVASEEVATEVLLGAAV